MLICRSDSYPLPVMTFSYTLLGNIIKYSQSYSSFPSHLSSFHPLTATPNVNNTQTTSQITHNSQLPFAMSSPPPSYQDAIEKIPQDTRRLSSTSSLVNQLLIPMTSLVISPADTVKDVDIDLRRSNVHCAVGQTGTPISSF